MQINVCLEPLIGAGTDFVMMAKSINHYTLLEFHRSIQEPIRKTDNHTSVGIRQEKISSTFFIRRIPSGFNFYSTEFLCGKNIITLALNNNMSYF